MKLYLMDCKGRNTYHVLWTLGKDGCNSRRYKQIFMFDTAGGTRYCVRANSFDGSVTLTKDCSRNDDKNIFIPQCFNDDLGVMQFLE